MNYEGMFVDASGRALAIRQIDDPNERYRIRVSLPAELDAKLRNHPDYPFEIADDLKGWIDRDDKAVEYLRVEAGILRINHLGPTLNLFPITEDQLKPNATIGLYDDWDDDLGLPWAFPLSIYHRRESNRSFRRRQRWQVARLGVGVAGGAQAGAAPHVERGGDVAVDRGE